MENYPMKKLLLSLALFGHSALADGLLSEFNINKKTIDFSKDDIIHVNFKQYYQDSSSYQLYKDAQTNEIFLDFKVDASTALVRQPDEIYKQNVPITLKPLLGTYLNDGYDKAEVVLNIRELDFYQSTVRQQQQFTIKILDSRESGKQAVTDPTGAWYQPSLSGVGFYVMQLNNGTAVQYYGYDNSGRLNWLVSDIAKDAWSKGKAKTIKMYTGNPDATTDFNKPPAHDAKTKEWGTLTLQFDSCTEGKATLTGIDGQQSFVLSKLTSPNNVNCVMHNNQ